MPLKLTRKAGGIWYYSGTVAGRRLRGSTRTAEKDIAQQIAARIEDRAWKSHIHGPEAVLTFAQAAILYRKAGKSTRFLEPIENFWRDTPVRQITAGAIKQSAVQLYPNAGPATRNRQAIVPTMAVINHAADSELCQRITVRRFAVERKEKEPATWEWIQAFMAHANPHLGALACFMFLTGARISEAIAVTWADVDLSRARVRIRQTKIGDERTAYMPAPLVAALANIEGERQGKVFKYSSRETARPQWDKVPKRAGIRKLSFHACRHGFATAMLHAGVDPVTVAKRGGWKSTAHLFATYGHAMEDETVVDRIFGEPLANNVTEKPKTAVISKP